MKIWKWTLDVIGVQTILMPKAAKVLSVHMQHGKPQLWALVDEDAPVERRKFATYGTGQPLPNISDHGEFVGTYQIQDALVFHVFDQS
jgi:hypothetical protein